MEFGRWLDEWNPNFWPPLPPSQVQLAEFSGVPRETINRSLHKLASRYDPPYLYRHDSGWSLTVHGIEYLFYRGMLRRFVKVANDEWGVRVAKLGLLYPT